ncbi:exosome complex protein Rrp42 [Candidatus Woesearchaeota archaeon]|nr:exosome complex protein Rrp42 [Candidatus Woesearchaeota archaeon]
MYEELRNEIISLLSKGTRLDGRKADEYREVHVETGVSKNAEGSAKVRIGDTEVISGVKLEVMTPYPDQPDDGSMMVNVELNPMSNPEFESGPPSMFAIELARITDRGIRESKTLDTKKLCIKSGEKIWMVVIDICTLNDDGNLFDAVALAAMAAMRDAVYPGFDGETIDYKHKTDEKLPLSKAPITVTVFKYDQHLIVDPTIDEMRNYDARLTVSVLENGNICSLQKGGDEAVDPEDLFRMIELAKVKSAELRNRLPK